MEKLSELIDNLGKHINMHEKENSLISGSPVGWHIEHSLLTINNIIFALQRSEPGSYKWKFNLFRTLVMTTKKIPRGRAKAPRIVQPEGNITIEKLKTHLDKTKERISIIETLKPDNYFEHPFFGKLNLKPAVKFLIIHTKHHTDIINDIIN